MPGKRKTPPQKAELPPLTDEEIIRRYLDVPFFEALMPVLAKPGMGYAELRALQNSTREALDAERYALSRRLSSEGLIKLLDIFGRKYDEPLWIENGALAGYEDSRPAFRDWKERCDACFEQERRELTASQADVIQQAKEILGDRWKDGPVDVREWMAIIIGEQNAANYADEILRAWSAYIGAQDLLREMESEDGFNGMKASERVNVLRTQIGQIEKIPEAQRSDAEKQNQRRAEELLAKTEESIDRRGELERFLENYTIGAVPSSWLRSRLSANFAHYWPVGRVFDSDELKANGVLKWHPFWQRHRTVFLNAQNEAAGLKEQISKTNEAKGKSGQKKKKKKRWILFSQTFQSWRGRRSITPELIAQFPKQEGVDEKKGAEFLRTLLTASKAKQRHSRNALSATLEGVGINLEQDVADECFAILFEQKVVEI